MQAPPEIDTGMTAATTARAPAVACHGSPFDLDDERAYASWRAAKLASAPTRVDELLVDVQDPAALSHGERAALLQRLATANMVLYRSPARADAVPGKDLVTRLGRQLGLARLDGHWLADEDGVSRLTVAQSGDDGGNPGGDSGEGRAGFIPYTDRAIKWHTDGYYLPPERRVRSMILHCVRPAREGGANALLDHELAYLLLRDQSSEHVRALMAPDAMTIPARHDADGVARPAQSGPVFSVDAHDGALHMRYTARTRSIEWKADAATRAAVTALEALLVGDLPWILRVRQEAGMGLIAHNVLHDRSAFVDDAAQPRLLYRGRFLDRTAAPARHQEGPWRNT